MLAIPRPKPLYVFHLNLAKLAANSSGAPPVALVGILFTAYTPTVAALVIGILWSTWHLWPVVVPGGFSLFSWTDFPQTYLRLTSTAILYAWLLNSTRGSLLLVLVAHGAYNIDTSIVQTPASDVHTIPIIVAVLHGLVALIVVLATNPRTLTRRGTRAGIVASELEAEGGQVGP